LSGHVEQQQLDALQGSRSDWHQVSTHGLGINLRPGQGSTFMASMPQACCLTILHARFIARLTKGIASFGL
jgi:hypothetical protein